MSTTPLVSIVLPVFDDDEWIGDALRSCTSQSLSAIEIICVDCSANTGSVVVAGIAEVDPRIRVIRQERTTSVPEARRAGATAAIAAYVLFLDADDELDHEAATQAYRAAIDSDADIVGFGTAVLGADGRNDLATQNRLEPQHPQLRDEDILRQLLPEGASVDGTIWRYLFNARLLRTVYEALPHGSATHLADDLPILFLACAAAKAYVSLATPLYRYHPYRDTAHKAADSGTAFQSAVSAIDSIEAIAPVVREWARNSPNPEPLVDGYESARLATIATALDLSLGTADDIQGLEAGALRARVSDVDIVAAAATFSPGALRALARRGDRIELGQKPVRNVLIATPDLTTEGISPLAIAQARVFLDAGCKVTIATRRTVGNESLVPDGVTLTQISGSTTRDHIVDWAELCRRHEIDVVVDHRILHASNWPGLALAARASGAATIGWADSFAGYPTYNGSDLHSLIQSNVDALAQLIVLSPLDVAFWKLRGVDRVAYLPTPPPSPLPAADAGAQRPAPRNRRLELVWWGRLEEHTKKVTDLVEVALALKRLGVHFRLRIVGPDGIDMTAFRLSALASRRGLDGLVEIVVPTHSEDLVKAIDSSDILINTSIIEGYLPTVPNAQSRGLPVVMYDMPWLLQVQNNHGVITVPQGDVDALAGAIAELAADPDHYEAMSRASVAVDRHANGHDFTLLYQHLVSGTLPAQFSPQPTLEGGKKALDLLLFFAEHGSGAKTSKSKAARRRARSRGESRPRTVGARVERKLTASGHQVLKVAPWLRPLARQVKHALLRL